MTAPVILDAVRTPFGRRDGALAQLHAAELLGMVQTASMVRAGVPADAVDQVIGGCATPLGEQYGNIVRTAWLHAGHPTAPGITAVDAMCGTSLQSLNLLAGQIATGAVDVGVACGVEVMSRVGLTAKQGLGLGTPRPASWTIASPDQFTAADRIAVRRGFSRRDLDEFGVRSQTLARRAWDEGRMRRQVLSVTAPADEAGDEPTVVTRDEGLRDTGLEALGRLRTVVPDGLHTAGTSSQISDGASAAVMASAGYAAANGLAPRGRIVAHIAVGGDMQYLLDSGIDGARRLLGRTGLTVADIDLFEVNEAFASIPMSFAKELSVPEDKLNVNGGAIAVGHPAGATGIRLTASVLDELEHRDAQFGLISICAASATTCVIVERL
ncbi:acetyl-CoA C-acyltransferase [Gordonia neofelifaecis]|uniref:Acetyl-CoA acetyltransferase n=1 Tax=Gordonia neofelifaecis NRRL B-59395 TaxID=644548 RepID=F1YNV0_9ACTN|nr:acetyl-CoA C-acyltransferase [Gordonia neofelifaecis]EGD53569.1 acetyl-CoA acetyltransferase [Gordonia neofelifaecis NRRL B-59395]